MKRKTLLLICVCEALILTALVVLTKHLPNLFSSMMAFPFEQIAEGLRLLSKAGSVGNGVSVVLWFGISAIPAIIALRYQRDKETLLERISLFVLSGAIFMALYGMVNPLFFRPANSENISEYIKLIKAIFGVSVWAVVVLFITLRLIRLFRQGNKEQLLKYMRTILFTLCFLFTADASVSLAEGLLSLLDLAQTTIDRSVGAFLLMAELTPTLFNIAIVSQVLNLLGIAAKDEQDEIVKAAKQVSNLCCVALGVTTAATALSNIIQIAAMRWLSNVAVSVDIPVISIVFVAMVLLFSQLLIENKRLRDDNSLFI
jgi:hypothetical protein